MPRTVQIPEIDDDVYDALQQRSAKVGLSVAEYLRREAERLAEQRIEQPSMAEWIEHTQRRRSDITAADVRRALDEVRGAWPE